MDFFSPAQIAGYVALALGVTAFLQKSDRRLKFFNAVQSLVYALHFALLGNLPASASALVSSSRSFLSLRYRSLWLCAAYVAAIVGVGAVFVKSPAGWLPVIGSAVATIAIFTMRGIPFRCVLLLSTLLWLANNAISGSVGGTVLEIVNAVVNIFTIIRMVRAGHAKPSSVSALRRESSAVLSQSPSPCSPRPCSKPLRRPETPSSRLGK